MVNIPGASGGFGVSQIPSEALFNDPTLMRRYRLAEIMSQSALGGAPPRTGFEALARAVQAGVGSHIASGADQSIRDREAAANDTYTRALQAGKGTPAMMDYTDAQGTENPIAAKPGGSEEVFRVLGTNRDTARVGNHMALTQMVQRDTMRSQLANQLYEKGMYVDQNGRVQAIPGFGAAAGANAGAQKGGEMSGALPYVGPTAEAQSGGTARGELPYVGPKAEADARARYPYQVGLEQSKPVAIPGQGGGLYLPNQQRLPNGMPQGSQPQQLGGALVGTPPNAQGVSGGPPGSGGLTSQPVSGGQMLQLPAERAGFGAEQQKRGEGLGEEAKVLRDGADAASGLQQRVQIALGASKGFTTGAFAEQKSQLGNALIALGVPADKVNSNFGNIQDAQVMQKEFFKMAADQTRQLGAREPGFVLQAFQRANPSLENLPGSNEFLLHLVNQDSQRIIDRNVQSQEYYNAAGANGQPRHTLEGFDKTFLENNPAEKYVVKAFLDSGQPVQLPSGNIGNKYLPYIPSGTPVRTPDGAIRTRP